MHRDSGRHWKQSLPVLQVGTKDACRSAVLVTSNTRNCMSIKNEWLLCTCAISPVLCCSCSGASDWPGEPRMGCLDAVHGPAVSPAEQAGTHVRTVPFTHWSCVVRVRKILLVILVDWEGHHHSASTAHLSIPLLPLPLLLPLPPSWCTTSWI